MARSLLLHKESVMVRSDGLGAFTNWHSMRRHGARVIVFPAMLESVLAAFVSIRHNPPIKAQSKGWHLRRFGGHSTRSGYYDRYQWEEPRRGKRNRRSRKRWHTDRKSTRL